MAEFAEIMKSGLPLSFVRTFQEVSGSQLPMTPLDQALEGDEVAD